jgi:large subunit ribosomal protein L25
MEQQVVAAQVRSKVGKNNSKALRGTGLVPATVYGEGNAPVSVTVQKRDLIKVYRGPRGKNTPISLQISAEGSETTVQQVLSYRVDRNPLSLEIEHVDFMRVGETSSVKVIVPLKLVGTAPGVKLGGMMMQNFSTITIQSVPGNIPDFVNVDLSELGVNDAIRVKSLENDQFKILTSRESIIVAVTAKGGKSEDTPGAAAGAKKK